MSLARPRGPLPARVYWFRRLLVLSLAVALVLGIGHLLGGRGADPADPEPTPAAAVGSPATSATGISASGDASAPAPASPTADVEAADRGRQDGARQGRRGKKARPREPLAVPTGPCRDDDVRVVPALEQDAYAGGDVRVTLRLRTYRSPACTWTVSAETVAVRLTSGSDRIWSSQDCPAAVPETPVVLRDRKTTRVEVTWAGRRSDADCSRTTSWAEPGYYHVAAAAMGSEPESVQFRLRSPAPVTVTPSPTPRGKRRG